MTARPIFVALLAALLIPLGTAAQTTSPQTTSPLAVEAKLYSPGDTVVPPGAPTTAKVVFRLAQPLPRQVAWDCGTVNGNTYAPQFFPSASYRLTFRPGETEKTLDVAVTYLGVGQYFTVGCAHSRNFPPITGYVAARIIGGDAPKPLPANPNPPPVLLPAALQTGKTLAFRSNFLTEPTAPIAKLGQWGTRPDYGLIIGNNEIGVMVDKSTHPGVDNHPIVAGRHVLRAQRLEKPIPFAVEKGGRPQNYRYAGSYLHAHRLPASHLQYGYIELRAKIDRAQGTTPAFWLLPVSGAWPPEIDVFEIGLGDSTELDSTVHGSFGAEGIRLPVSPANDGRFHDFGFEITRPTETQPSWLITLLDGVELTRRRNPWPGETFYMIINVAVGGLSAPPARVRPGWKSEITLDHVEVWK